MSIAAVAILTRSLDSRKCINEMAVRGAPAIGITGALSLATDLLKHQASLATANDVCAHALSKADYLVTA